jgi:hypothetical protein
MGGRVQVHGHGKRRRTQRGPETIGQPSVEREVQGRRYRCTQCGATVTVAASGVVRRRLYGACAIALALALFGVEGQTARSVRGAIAPTASQRAPAEGASWSTLRRWAGDAKAGMLTDDSRACPDSFTLRQAAERAARMFQALGPRGAEGNERVWQGALVAHWRGTS